MREPTTLRRARLAIACAALVALAAPPVPADDEPPRTGFEEREGATWTTHDEEVSFLRAVEERSGRVTVSTLGRTIEGRPLHLVRLGATEPRPTGAGPVALFMCAQHGNEPAGREACLAWIRDLAFTDDPALVAQMRAWTLLFVPTANPDGREANNRGNAADLDVNRDHLNLETPEARAIGTVIRDWRPSFVMDHHEYGPGQPVIYDDDVLYLWPRNLNVDPRIRSLGKSFSIEHLKPCLEASGYSADEYGLAAVGDVDVEQTAGDGDEGIARNTAGLRHAVGILIESAVSPKSMSPTEAVDGAHNMRRRVDSQQVTMGCALAYLRARGDEVHAASLGSRARAARIGARRSEPVYFNGQDEDTTVTGRRDEPTVVADPPPCGYRLTADQAEQVSQTLQTHGVLTTGRGIVPLGQEARSVVPLLLDERGRRNATAARPLSRCPSLQSEARPRVLAGRQTPATGVARSAWGTASLLVCAALVGRYAIRSGTSR